MSRRNHPILAGSAAPAPAAAGHRPLMLVAALSACFAGPALAQPTGAQAIHGAAALTQQGNKLVVTTQNGAGTSHSAINWQSFGIPAGTSAHFAQPGAASTSINRVVGHNPSAILGTLSSNGRLVLVNPAGIAVGAGAMVDTAGFTASTLRMSDADALAGRLRFGGDGAAAGPLTVNGNVVARGGDVVLIAPDVHVGAGAVVQSVGGDTVLAAGQKVEVTGRGLEGIRLELKAPADKAVNLGTLKGDSVGLFASQLRHSGLVHAQSATRDGGKVVLKAAGETLVDGNITAAAGDRGGAIDVFGQKVELLGTASLDASGWSGGGSIRIGGDFQGANASVQNAAQTSVGRAVTIRASAGPAGDGGRVIVWADGLTRMEGTILARGGSESGNGGFAEVSGRQQLEFTGRVDLRAPRGRTGTLLLDPEDIEIGTAGPPPAPSSSPSPAPTPTPTPAPYLLYVPAPTPAPTSYIDATVLSGQLDTSDVLVKTTTGSIRITQPVSWSTNALALDAYKDIQVNADVTAPTGKLALISTGVGQNGTITQSAAIKVQQLILGTTTGAATLTHASNQISSLAANVGSLTLSNSTGLALASLTNALVSPSTVTGIVSGGPVTLNVAGSISHSGSASIGTYGGAVVLQTSAGGDILFSNIVTNLNAVSVGVAGGAVTLNAAGHVNGNAIGAHGYTGTVEGEGKNGGLIIITAGGNIDLNTVQSYGSHGSAGVAPGGLGGNMSLTSSGGQVTALALSTYGGDGTVGRKAGSITISASAAPAPSMGVSLGSVNAFGGAGTGASGNGGEGGTVTLLTNRNIDFTLINATGGASSSGLGGKVAAPAWSRAAGTSQRAGAGSTSVVDRALAAAMAGSSCWRRPMSCRRPHCPPMVATAPCCRAERAGRSAPQPGTGWWRRPCGLMAAMAAPAAGMAPSAVPAGRSR